MKSIPLLTEENIIKNLNLAHNPFFESYYAFFSSWFGGIVKNPHYMLLPIDDHMVHRGDGVFEAMKAVDRSVYLLDEHLHRLLNSAEKIGLKSPFSFNDIKNIILQTLQTADKNDASIRIFLSRGPGSFSMNPYDSIQSQLYVMVTKLVPPSEEKYAKGVHIGKSHVPLKSSWMAQVKSCNYLPNVLMKKEAIDRHLDFVIGIDEMNHIYEGSGENIMIVDQTGNLAHPPVDSILKGTTMTRVAELAREHDIATEVRQFSYDELLSAREVMMTGTTIDILPVVKFEDCPIGNGMPGAVFKNLQTYLHDDIRRGPRRTPF